MGRRHGRELIKIAQSAVAARDEIGSRCWPLPLETLKKLDRWFFAGTPLVAILYAAPREARGAVCLFLGELHARCPR